LHLSVDDALMIAKRAADTVTRGEIVPIAGGTAFNRSVKNGCFATGDPYGRHSWPLSF